MPRRQSHFKIIILRSSVAVIVSAGRRNQLRVAVIYFAFYQRSAGGKTFYYIVFALGGMVESKAVSVAVVFPFQHLIIGVFKRITYAHGRQFSVYIFRVDIASVAVDFAFVQKTDGITAVISQHVRRYCVGAVIIGVNGKFLKAFEF